MNEKIQIDEFSEKFEAHLARYLKNRKKRTGQKWVVVERYYMWTSGWDRALIKAEDGSSVRIYHPLWSKCWVAEQQALIPGPTN